MTRKTIFWVVFTLTSILSLLYFVNNYNKAFPSLSLDVTMNREMALDAAKELSKRYNWEPENGNSAITFYSERETQTFIEREGGGDFKEGLEIFKNLFQDSLYFPYGWKVRYFEEKNPNEVIIKFTPAGNPYGFYQKLGEDEIGDSLSRDSAFVIATQHLKRDWGVDLSKFELIDESQKIQPNGRIDHSFVYERASFKLGEEGALRLKLSVSGNKLTEVNNYVHVPEGFKRRFGEIRSFNDTIAFSANMFIFLLYGLAGCVYGIFILLRQKRVLWKGALKWGLGIAFIQSLMQLNFLPMLWMEYDTASTENSFMIQIILGALANALVMGFIYTLSFIAAEGLSRKAFPNHVQFWKLFSSRTSNSLTVLGQSLGGYLGTGLFMFYALAFYTFTKSLGWWSPTDTEYDPNILAAYFPWLTSIAISLGAGFWEECLFRAVPLAGAALIGEYYGKRKMFIGIGMVVQAVIFGAAHANYPVQPAYARVVELMIPSFAFGFIYLQYGLLPGIIMHYAYDVAMISLQIFSADVPGIWLQRCIIIFFLLVPIWVILFFRIKFGRWVHKLGSIYNRDWEEPYETHNKNEEFNFKNLDVLIEPKLFKKSTLIVCAIIGLFFWGSFSKFSTDLPALKISKHEAIRMAEKAFNEKSITFDTRWVRETQVQAWTGNQGKFIWKTQGKVLYDSLVGNYLPESGWRVRYRLRDGTTEERAEEYSCWVTNSGNVGITHTLPESSPSESIGENEARELAQSAISKTYNLNFENLTELEAKSEKKPNRMDWFFRYRDNTNETNVGNGELRINIKIAGNEIVNIWKEVFIPENWLRLEEEKQSKNMPFNLIEALVIALTVLLAVVFAIIRWSKKQFSISIFIKSLIFLMVLRVISSLNNFSNTVWNFSTSKPYASQLYQSIFSDLVMSVLFMSFIAALIIGLTHKLIQENTNNGSSLLNGIYLGIFVSGILSFVYSLYPQIEPSIGRFWDLNYEIPFLGGMLSFVGNFIQMTLLNLSVCIGLVSLTKNWSKLLPVGIAYIIALGFVASISGSSTFESIPIWIGSSLALSLVIYAIHRDFIQYNIHLIPTIVGTMIVLNIVRNGIINTHSGVYLISALSILSVGLLSYTWSNQLMKPGKN